MYEDIIGGIAVGLSCLTVFMIILLIKFNSAKKTATCEYQASESTVELLNVPINDAGNVRIGSKTFLTEGVKAKILKTRWGHKPFLRFKYDVPHALPFAEDEQVSEVQPEAITRIGSMKTLDKLMNPQNELFNKTVVIIILVIAALCFLIGVMAAGSGAISFGGAAASVPSTVVHPAI